MDKMKRILRDWLLEQARRTHLARSVFLALIAQEKVLSFGHIINPLLTKPVGSRWLGIDLVLFWMITQIRTWPISSHLYLMLVQYHICIHDTLGMRVGPTSICIYTVHARTILSFDYCPCLGPVQTLTEKRGGSSWKNWTRHHEGLCHIPSL